LSEIQLKSFKKENPEDFRYERKFLTTSFHRKQAEQFLKFNPAAFSPIFSERTVNNIYFDTLGFTSYVDNVEGEKSRVKIRIRWYGELFGKISKPVLEYKIKKGLAGRKESFLLNDFSLNSDFSKAEIEKAVDRPDLPEFVKNELLHLQPALLNSYKRCYFLSADKDFRVTIDSDLTYYKITYHHNTFLNCHKDMETLVLEMKYHPHSDEKARNISNHFPFPLTKSSKYLQGLERVLL
jgi:SPX domain protein involved in polyphosphate accumulation